jgi:hypothetical protein
MKQIVQSQGNRTEAGQPFFSLHHGSIGNAFDGKTLLRLHRKCIQQQVAKGHK